MGNKILVSVFDTEPAAFEGLTALKELHREGDISVYATSVIVKDHSGAVAVRQTAEKGPLGTLAGVVTGGLVGLLGGPAGAAVGAYIGGVGGMIFDLFRAGVGIDFVEEVGTLLTPGKAAVVADVEESWVTPVNTRMAALGGTTFRRLPGEVVDAQLIRESAAAEQELDEIQAEIDADFEASSEEMKAKLRNAKEAQQRKLEATSERIQKTMNDADAQFEARMATLREQRSKAREHKQARIDARMDELKKAHEERKAKLTEARQLAKKSLEATREALVS